MTRPSLPQRAIRWIERYLPAPRLPGASERSTGQRRGFVVFVAMLPIVVVNLLQVARHHAELGAAWPAWRPMVLELMLVIAGSVLVAGMAFGVHAWGRGADA